MNLKKSSVSLNHTGNLPITGQILILSKLCMCPAPEVEGTKEILDEICFLKIYILTECNKN